MIGSGSLTESLLPNFANFSTSGPPGYPKSNIFAVLSNASPKASSIVVPNCSYSLTSLTIKY